MRTLAALSLLLLVLSLPGCSAPAPQRAELPALEVRAVSPRVWYFEGVAGMATRDNRGFTSNAGFVVTDDGIVVFDALATPALARAMLAGIRTISDRPIRHLVVSHYHADHIYGLQVFKAAGAEIWARAEGRHYLASASAQERLEQRRRELAPWVDAETRLLAADHWLHFDDDAPIRFELGGVRFELINGGDAHSAGDLMLSIPEQGVLFAGDLFFTGRLPYVVDGNTREWLGALDRIERSAPHTVIPGHGTVSTNVHRDLQTTRAYLQFLRRSMGDAAAQLEDFDAAYAATDWSRFSALPTFAEANRRNAYTVYLEMQQELLGDGASPPSP